MIIDCCQLNSIRPPSSQTIRVIDSTLQINILFFFNFSQFQLIHCKLQMVNSHSCHFKIHTFDYTSCCSCLVTNINIRLFEILEIDHVFTIWLPVIITNCHVILIENIRKQIFKSFFVTLGIFGLVFQVHTLDNLIQNLAAHNINHLD